jgi:hypothetical protein
MLVACKWYSSCVWIELVCDYTLLSSKEPNAISYEEWRALWMDTSDAYSGLSVVLRSSCCAGADCCLYASYCLGDIDVVCSAVAWYALCYCLLIDLRDILSRIVVVVYRTWFAQLLSSLLRVDSTTSFQFAPTLILILLRQTSLASISMGTSSSLVTSPSTLPIAFNSCLE